MNTLLKNSFTGLLFLSASILFTSCNNPASSEDEEHSDPFGVALFLNGLEIASLENGVVTYADGDHIKLEVGEETDKITVRWISEDGDRFVPDENEGYSLRWSIVNENVLDLEQHDEDGAWSFHFVGLSEGEAEVTLNLYHNGHSDFTSPQPFEVHVEQAVSGMELRDGSGNALISIDDSGSVTGSVQLTTNETTEELTAVFLDDKGSVIDTVSEYELEWHIESGAEYVAFERSSTKPFVFTLTGTAEGQATIHFELIKEDGGNGGDDDHAGTVAYKSSDITINVN